MTALDLNIDSVATYDDGRSFGSTGPYELLRGRLSIVVDPKNAANSRITDIQFAERQADGRVHLKADALILQPIETERGNGALLAVPPNRGYVGDLPFSLVDSMTDPCDLRSGDGFLLRRGWSVAWIGWQWDVSRYGNLLGCTVPEALDAAGNPIAGWTNLMFTPVSTLPYHPLNSPLPGWSPEMPDPTSGRYPTVDVNDAEATLTEACHGHDPRPIPRDAWKFAREHDGTVIADDSNVWLSGGFRGGRTYELHYRTRACPVVGTGLLSFRDAISFLRNGSDVRDSPLTARVEHVLGWGVSQSGRFLREFLHAGCNIDEFGRRVLDAALPFVAGASRGEFNERYGKPGELFAPGLGQTPPFALDSTSAGGGLLDTQRSVGQSPKVVIVNSGSEYWRGDGAHTHISTDGTHDLSEQADTRVYLIAGTDHVSGTHMPFDSQRSLPNRLSPLLV